MAQLIIVENNSGITFDSDWICFSYSQEVPTERNDWHCHASASSCYRWTIIVLLCYAHSDFDHLINDLAWSIHCIVANG